MSLLISALSIALGFIGLIWSADKFVLGASTAARNLGVSPLLIGLTIVAFGTSAPEVFTSAVAALKGAPQIALGNALGSNIANIGLVLGVTALAAPLVVPSTVLRKELPIMLGVSALGFLLMLDLKLDLLDGLILVSALVAFTWYVTHSSLKDAMAPDQEAEEYIADMSTLQAVAWLLLGLGLMLLSSNILVNGARDIALFFGISELVIGLTIIAIGTSLPELATSVASALKGHHDLAIGNIIGSNIFNLLLVLPVPAFLSPFSVDSEVLWRDYSTMLLLTLVLSGMLLITTRNQKGLGRVCGSILLLLYLTYTGFLLVMS